MGKLKRLLRCFNCGEILQSKDEEKLGYIPADVLKEEGSKERVVYCQNCYEKMKAINTGLLEQEADDDILLILKEAVVSEAVILWVVDLFSFNGLVNPEVAKVVKGLDVIVIGTKFDLLPRGSSIEHSAAYLKERFVEAGIEPKKVTIFGNDDDLDYDKIIKDVYEDSKGHDVYMIGSSLSGKTSLINRALKKYQNKSNRFIQTITYPNTNAQMLSIPLTKETTFYEVPGFSLVNSIYGKVEKDVAKIITPHEKVKPTYRTLGKGDGFIIGSLAAFVLESGKATVFKFYASDKVETKRALGKNVKQEFMNNYLKRGVRPVSDRISTFQDYDVFEYSMENDDKLHDIAISGLGWVTFLAKGQTIRVYLPKGVAVKECLSRVK